MRGSSKDPRDLMSLLAQQDAWFDSDLESYREQVCELCSQMLSRQASDEFRTSDEFSGWSPEFQDEFRRMLGQHDLLGWSWPDPYGRGKSILYDVVLADELEYHDAPAGAALDSSIIHVPHLLLRHASPTVLDEVMPRFRRGEIGVLLAYSEAQAGSDLAALQLAAIPEDDESGGRREAYRLSGYKTYSSDAHTATHAVVAGRIPGSGMDKHQGITLFWIPMDRPGISVQFDRTIAGARHPRVSFENVLALSHEVIGLPAEGWRILTQGLSAERAVLGNPGLAERELIGNLYHHSDVVQFSRYRRPYRSGVLELVAEMEARVVSYGLAAALALGQQARGYDASLGQIVKRESVRALQGAALDASTPGAGWLHNDDVAEWHWMRDLFYLFAAGGFDVSREIISRDILR